MVSAIGSSSFPSLVAVPNAALWGHASVSIALQLFSMRRLGSIDAQLEASRDAGFKIVECLQIHIHEPSIFRTMLDVRGLECTTLHVEYQFLIDNAGSILDACLIVGIRSVFVHDLRIQKVRDASQWARAGSRLGILAERFSGSGIELGFHNGGDCFDLLKSGRSPIEELFRSDDSGLLKWQADIGWIRLSGADPIVWLRRLKSRLVAAHIKDVATSVTRGHEWTDVGDGILVLPLVIRSAVQEGARLLVAEHDDPEDPERFANSAYLYLSRFT
jgi:sugar phosphate isomerase/epimerase